VEEEEKDDTDTNSEYDDASDSEGDELWEQTVENLDEDASTSSLHGAGVSESDLSDPCTEWVSEVEATIQRAIDEDHQIDNLRLELKTLKLTFEHRTFSDSTLCALALHPILSTLPVVAIQWDVWLCVSSLKLRLRQVVLTPWPWPRSTFTFHPPFFVCLFVCFVLFCLFLCELWLTQTWSLFFGSARWQVGPNAQRLCDRI